MEAPGNILLPRVMMVQLVLTSATQIYTQTLGGAATFQLSVNIANGWNMVSVPGLHPVDQNVNTWWAFRDMGANVFRYAGGYQSVTAASTWHRILDETRRSQNI